MVIKALILAALAILTACVAKISDAEVSAALAHNEKGAALCGWKP